MPKPGGSLNPSIRGRGAAHNPANRFDLIQIEREAWTQAEDPAPETRFYRDATRSIIATNNSPDIGFEASVNPYRGCDRGCVYCAGGETPILKADGTLRRLADLRIGDEIYGSIRAGRYRRYVKTRVLAHWETEKPAYRITLEDGTELVASGDHRFLTLRGWKFVTGRQQGSARRPHLTTNDKLLGVGGLPVQTPRLLDYEVGYVCGIIRGDGHLAAHTNIQVDSEGLVRTRGFLRHFGIETTRFVFRNGNGRPLEDIVAWPQSPSMDWSKGFLAGIFDAEGSYSHRILRIPNTDSAIVEATSRSMRRLGFNVALECVRRDQAKPITVVRLRGGIKEHLRFFHTVDPAILRKRNIEGQGLKSRAKLRVASIEPIGRRTLFDITTGTGDFIANGVVSHNCYARPTHEYFGLSAGLDFETKIFVKEDAPDLLRRELSSPRWEPKLLVMSGVTDPYQSVEKRLRITRGCLEVLAEFRNPVSIITKSHLVTRDIDLLGDLARYRAAAVNLSITSLRRDVQRVMEPRAATPKRRLDAIRQAAAAGIPAGVMVAPVIPGLTDHELPEILARAAEAGAVRAGYIMLRLPHGVKELFEDWLERHFPDRKEKVLNRLRDLRGGRLYDSRYGARMRGEGAFAKQVEQMFEVACRKAGLNRRPVELSTAAFRRSEPGRQLSFL